MIDRVELVVLNQSLKMRELERDHPVRGQQVRHSCREVVKIGNLRQYIVADDEIGLAPLGDKTLRKIQAEELDQRRNILRARRLGNVCSWLDTNDWNIQR